MASTTAFQTLIFPDKSMPYPKYWECQVRDDSARKAALASFLRTRRSMIQPGQ